MTGSILTTPEKTAFRLQFLPGQANRIFDFGWRSGNDAAWDALLERLGGKEVVQPRFDTASFPNLPAAGG